MCLRTGRPSPVYRQMSTRCRQCRAACADRGAPPDGGAFGAAYARSERSVPGGQQGLPSWNGSVAFGDDTLIECRQREGDAQPGQHYLAMLACDRFEEPAGIMMTTTA